MYTVIEERTYGVFDTVWYKILGPLGLSFQAYLNKDEAHGICEEKNLNEKHVSAKEIAIIRAKAEQKILQKKLDKMNNS
jgi:hypothetical protein